VEIAEGVENENYSAIGARSAVIVRFAVTGHAVLKKASGFIRAFKQLIQRL